jgi:hypothetical protein
VFFTLPDEIIGATLQFPLNGCAKTESLCNERRCKIETDGRQGLHQDWHANDSDQHCGLQGNPANRAKKCCGRARPQQSEDGKRREQ